MMKLNLVPGFLVAYAFCYAQIGIGLNVTTFDDSEVFKDCFCQ